MSTDAIALIVALARSAFVLCQNMKMFHDNAVRIGQRLMVLIAATKDWTNLEVTVKSVRSLGAMEMALNNVNLALQASTTKKISWTNKVATFMKGTTLLAALEKSEKDLDNALQDFQIQQNNEILRHVVAAAERHERVYAKLNRVEVILSLLAKTGDPSHPGQTLDQGITDALNTCSMVVSVHTKPNFDVESGDMLPRELQIDISQVECSYNAADLLGEGGFSEVYCGTYKGDTVAIKRIKISRTEVTQATSAELVTDARRLACEAVVASRCGIHANILQVYGCYPVISPTERPLLVMEYMSMTLFHALRRRLPATFAERYEMMKGIASAIEFLHLQGIVHFDIKTLNVLVDATLTVAKLSDFGESKVKGLATTRLRRTAIMTALRSSSSGNEGGAPQKAGTMAYLAPEILTDEVQEPSRAADMYAFGVTLWECLTGDIPHRDKNAFGLFKLATSKRHELMLELPEKPWGLNDAEDRCWSRLHTSALSCLQRNSRQRPTASTVVSAWNNEAFTESAALVDGEMKISALAVLGTSSTAESSRNASLVTPLASNDEQVVRETSPAESSRRWLQFRYVISLVLLLILLASVAAAVVATRPPPEPPGPNGAPTSAPSSTVPDTLRPTDKMPTMPPAKQNPSVTPISGQTSIPTPDTPEFSYFSTNVELRNAVFAYVRDTSAFSDTAVRYGHPIGSWDVSRITDFSFVFSVAPTFTGDLSGWNTSSATEMQSMFSEARFFDGDISAWDVSNVNDFTGMFQNASSFSGDLSQWDVSSATRMRSMFFNASSFTGEIGSWDVSNVEDFSFMFYGATLFSSDLPNWDVSSGIDMGSMFENAVLFNGNISAWDVSNVEDFSFMFSGAERFSGDVSNWDVSSGNDMKAMFQTAVSFNGNISAWDVSNVVDFSHMFYDATLFSGDLSNWDVSSGNDMKAMFQDAVSFNGNISAWDVSNVVDFSYMFYNATLFSGDLSNWDVSAGMNMSRAFANARAFNGNISHWNVSNVRDMAIMFYTDDGVSAFNGDVSTWDVSNVNDFTGMFQNASSFSGDLSQWDVSSATRMRSMFSGASSFNGEIGSWDVLNVEDFSFMFSGAERFSGDVSNWNVSSGNDMKAMFQTAVSFSGNVSAWDVSNVQDFSFMFYGATQFVGDLSNWDVSSGNDMNTMFYDAVSFNGNISAWDVSNVVDFSFMFRGAMLFSGDLSNWDVSAGTNMFAAFAEAPEFNGNISTWNVSNVKDMAFMFHAEDGVSAFNGNISSWDVSNVEDFSSMFYGAASFSADLSNWNTPSATMMPSMFSRAVSFRSDIGAWDVSSVTDFSYMFNGTTSFDADLCGWNVASATNLTSFLNGAEQYAQTLCCWAGKLHRDAVTDQMFNGTACPVTSDPDLDLGTPLCFQCMPL